MFTNQTESEFIISRERCSAERDLGRVSQKEQEALASLKRSPIKPGTWNIPEHRIIMIIMGKYVNLDRLPAI